MSDDLAETLKPLQQLPDLVGRLRDDGLPDICSEAANEIEELQGCFDIRWKADMRAIKMWQAAHPGSENIWPDHAEMVLWLMEQLTGKGESMAFKPLYDQVLVKLEPNKRVTDGGIIIPEGAQEQPQIAEVLAVGPGALNSKGVRAPMSVAVGDWVLINKWAGNELTVDGVKAHILREYDIMGVID